MRPTAHSFNFRRLTSIAACFAIVLAAFLVAASFSKGTVVSIYETELTDKSCSFEAESAPSMARSTSEETKITVRIPVTVSVSEKTTVRAESGRSYLDLVESGSDDVSSAKSTGDLFLITDDTSFIWNIEVSESETEHKLMIIGEKKTETVTVVYDFAAGTYTAMITE